MKVKFLKYKIIKVWNSKWNILSGFINFIFRKVRIEKIAKERISICRSNKCGYYDKDSSMDKSIGNLGQESCGACGCVISIKTRCLEVSCGMEDIDKLPLWQKYDKI